MWVWLTKSDHARWLTGEIEYKMTLCLGHETWTRDMRHVLRDMDLSAEGVLIGYH